MKVAVVCAGAGRAVGCGLLLGLLVAGCGQNPPAVGHLTGAEVGRMAEHELEAQNPRLAAGTLSCPELALELGAAVRCLRTTRLSGGRVVEVAGTVTVTSVTSGGRLHVAMDERAREFGLTGSHLATELRRRYRPQSRTRPSRVVCPYLRGVVGTRVTCRLDVGGERRDVDVVVTAVDPVTYTTSWTPVRAS